MEDLGTICYAPGKIGNRMTPEQDMKGKRICLERRGTGGQRGDGGSQKELTFPVWKGTRLDRLSYNRSIRSDGTNGDFNEYGDNYQFSTPITRFGKANGEWRIVKDRRDGKWRTPWNSTGRSMGRRVCLERRGTGGQ